MVRLLDALDRARADPGEDFHFALQLDRIFDSVENEEELSEETWLHLDEMAGEYLLPDLVDNLEDWYSDGTFQSARDALDQFEDAIADAEDRGWVNVTAQYQYRRIHLKAGLQGHDATDELEEALEFIENYHIDDSPNFTTSIIEAAIDNIDDVPDPHRDRWIDLIEANADAYRTDNRFNQLREYLRLLHELKQACDRDTSDVETALVDSYRREAELVGRESLLQKADILQSGVAECAEYLSDEQKRDWKQEAIQARRTGTETELHEFDPNDLDVDGIEGESLQQAVAEEMEHNTQVYIDWFKHVKQASGSGSYALYCLALSSSLIPDPNKIRLSTEEFVISQLVSRQIISPEAHTLSVDPSDPESIPNNYAHHAAGKMSSLGNALYRLIKQGHLTLSDIFHIFAIGDTLSPNTEAFLTDALLELHEDNHRQALFLFVPHLEATIVDTLQSIGRPAYTIIDEGTQQQLLGGLFIDGRDLFGRHYAIYLRYRYTSREGMNLRNRLSHGQLRYRNANYLNAVLTLFDILKCLITLNSADYLNYFGIPQQSLSPPTQYDQETDLSLFTDLNKQIIGYGTSTDGHTLVVVRENGHEGHTDLFVDRGRIHRYLIDGTGLTRDEIDQLRDDYPNIPDSIDYTWLDQDDLILPTITNVIDDQTAAPADAPSRDTIIEHAKVRGIDESTTRTALRRLEERGDITIRGLDRETVVPTDECLHIFEQATRVTGIGETLAWRIADHFDSEQAFFDADQNAFQAIPGIGPDRAHRLATDLTSPSAMAERQI
ncbi:DUF4209 domain-containing protein [Natrinema salsiterrestre]|uniref:DUF4209 domain-containing protein n=1 Tax=Natrinema salsiterrestre TaxID=2950540 RepID=A0A9Q4Q3J3_9EURY|nr:DUF4209 domain-containing protein [Natrinema salsiterrestre]MDF9746298.1 DUF4209 domain-containing protein [Natrinema salsiterrestre]